MHRHGDRNELPYLKSPWKNKKYWPGGYGQLTDVGKLQCCDLGIYIRNRYRDLIENKGVLDENSIYIRSTFAKRAIQSAKYVSACMFSTQVSPFKDVSDIPLSSIPINSVPRGMDTVLYIDKQCPLYYKAYEEYEKSHKIKLKLKKYRKLLRYLEKHSGNRVRSFCNVLTVYDGLWVEQLKNFA